MKMEISIYVIILWMIVIVLNIKTMLNQRKIIKKYSDLVDLQNDAFMHSMKINELAIKLIKEQEKGNNNSN